MQAIVSLFKALGGGWQHPPNEPESTPNLFETLKKAFQ
jgi:hypothetical protein